jgi:hypothetical protein
MSKPRLPVRRNDEENATTMEAIGFLAFCLFTFVVITRDPEEN